MKKRGAAMLYSLMMSVIAAGIVGGVVRMAAVGSGEEARAERKLRARAMADLQLSLISSWAQDGSLVVGEVYTVTSSNVSTRATTTALTNPTGLIQVEQTVKVGNTSFLFRDYVAMPTQSVSFVAPTWSGASDTVYGAVNNPSASAGQPDFLVTTMDSDARLSHTVSSFSQTVASSSTASPLVATALGLTQSQLRDYEFVVFQAVYSGSSNLNNVSFDIVRGNSFVTTTGAASAAVARGTISAADYATAFGILTSAPGTLLGINVAAINVDSISGGPALMSGSGPWDVTVFNVNTLNGNQAFAGTSADIDAILYTGTAESTTQNGLLMELGQYVSNIFDGGTATAPTPTYVRRIEPMPGRPNGSAVRWASSFGSSNKWATYSGMITAPVTGAYQFQMQHDNAARLFIGGNYIVGNWYMSSGTVTSGIVNLTAGQQYPIVIEHMEGGGGEVLILRWTYPGQSYIQIPTSAVTPGLGSETAYFNDFEANGLTTPEFTLTYPRNSSHGNGPQGNTVPGSNGVSSLPGASRILGDFGAPSSTALVATTIPISGTNLFTAYGPYNAGNQKARLEAAGQATLPGGNPGNHWYANPNRRSWQVDWVQSTGVVTFRVWSSSDYSGSPAMTMTQTPVMTVGKVLSGLSIGARTSTTAQSIRLEGVEFDSGAGWSSTPSANGIVSGNTLMSTYFTFDGNRGNFSLRGIASMPSGTSTSDSAMRFFVTGVQSDLSEVGNNFPGARLNLGIVPAGRIILYCEPTFLQSWDGNGGFGPDRFRLTVNGVNHFDFSPSDSPQPLILNGPISTQFYSSNGPVFAFPMGTPGSGGWKYSVRTEFDHPGGNLTINFEGWGAVTSGQPTGLQPINDESWALDNISIRRVR